MIRKVQPSDVAGLKDVIGATDLFPPDMLDDMLAGWLSGASMNEIWLVDDDGGPVAVAFCAPEAMTSGTWNLYLIAVHPERQDEGRGAALVAQVEAALSDRGARLLLVETSGQPRFDRTRGFYRRIGFSEEARIRDFYGADDDKVVFRKAIAAG